MLELPESYTIAKQMNQMLKGKIISYIEVLQTPHKFAFMSGEADLYEEYLEGQTITGAAYHGGIVEIDTEDSVILLSDGAYPKYIAETDAFPKRHQFALHFDDGSGVSVSVRMYGGIGVHPKGTCKDGFYLSSSQKPDPLSDAFSYEYFRNLYPGDGKKMSVKAFLATKQRIPGVGNGVLQDILWDAGLDPRFDMQQMEEEDFQTLYHSVRKILKEMAEHGGRDTEQDLFGKKGGYVTQLSKNSLYEPCIKCGCEIQKASYMGGTIYFCERCQRR